ncbi:MFS transporter [Devosia sp.]|uniref:MFS transporter n=1 Tax=Devosia sp. TaxID=1871048 RepID=UPI0032645118
MPSALVQRFSPELRAAVFHFTVFGSAGASSVYFAIWLTGKGISAGEIGLINALPVLVLLLINQLIGRIADRAGDWRSVIIVLALFAGMVPIGLFFVNSFWGILAVWTLCALGSGSIPPVTDAATVRLTQRNGTDFGTVRAWGTVGYMVCTVASGWIIAWLGPVAFLPLFLGLSLLRTAAAWQLPRFRAPAHEPTLAGLKSGASRISEMFKPWFLLPLIGFALVNSSHSVLSGFAALVWHDNGVADGYIGPLIAVGAAAEAVMMFAWRRVGGNISARQMMLIAAIACMVRWTVMAFNPPVAVLFVLQTLHALTYGVGYFGAVHFIANWTSEDIAAEAQGLAVVFQQAATVFALIGFGWLVNQFGIGAFFGPVALGAVGAGCIVASLIMRPAKAH